MYFFCVATEGSCVYLEKHDTMLTTGHEARWEIVAQLAEEGKTADDIDLLIRCFGL